MVKVITQGPIASANPYRLTTISFHCNRPSRSWYTGFFLKIWPLKSKVNFMVEVKVQRKFDFLSTHVPVVLGQSVPPSLWHGFFKIWLWKSKVKVIAQCYIVGATFYRLIFLLTFKIQGQSNGRGQSLKPLPFDWHFLRVMSFGPPVPAIRFIFFNIWPWKTHVNVLSRWLCITARL